MADELLSLEEINLLLQTLGKEEKKEAVIEEEKIKPLGGDDMALFKGVKEVMPYINYTWKRHKVILSNLANADTPNYKAKDDRRRF